MFSAALVKKRPKTGFQKKTPDLGNLERICKINLDSNLRIILRKNKDENVHR